VRHNCAKGSACHAYTMSSTISTSSHRVASVPTLVKEEELGGRPGHPTRHRVRDGPCDQLHDCSTHDRPTVFISDSTSGRWEETFRSRNIRPLPRVVLEVPSIIVITDRLRMLHRAADGTSRRRPSKIGSSGHSCAPSLRWTQMKHQIK
jgi:hypothetical protein